MKFIGGFSGLILAVITVAVFKKWLGAEFTDGELAIIGVVSAHYASWLFVK